MALVPSNSRTSAIVPSRLRKKQPGDDAAMGTGRVRSEIYALIVVFLDSLTGCE